MPWQVAEFTLPQLMILGGKGQPPKPRKPSLPPAVTVCVVIVVIAWLLRFAGLVGA